MVKKGMSVRIASDDEAQLNPDTLPLVPPPPPAASHLNKKNNDEQPFCSIEMQQEDRFFYEDRSTNEPSYTAASNPMHEPWSSTMALDPGSKTLLQNPFEDLSRQNTLTNEPVDYDMDKTSKLLRDLENDKDKQAENEDRSINIDSKNNSLNITTEDSKKSSLDEDKGSDEDFDWNDDPDQTKPKRRKTARERFTAAMKNPCWWHYLSPAMKRIIIAVLGSVLFVVIAVVIYITLPEPTEAQKQDPNFNNVRSNLQCWMYWAAFMWHIFWIMTFLLDMIPSLVSLWAKLFHGRRSEKVKSYMEYYMNLKGYFCLVLLAAWNLGSWAFLISVPFNSIQKHAYSHVITKLFGSFLAASGLFFIQKTVIQVIGFNFHRTAFKERIEENKKCLNILDTLSKSETKSRPGSGMAANNNLRKRKPKQGNQWESMQSSSSHDEKFGNTHRPITLSDESVPVNQPSSFAKFKKSISGFVLAEKPSATTTGRIDKNKMDINSDNYAKKVAKKLFYALAYPEGYYGQEEDDKKYLDIFAFTPYFKDREAATEAFRVFDKDGNGNLSRREFRDTVIQIYRERKSLAQSIQDTSQALGKIDIIFLILTSILSTVICLAIFQIDFYSALLPLGSILVACTFIFDSSAKSLFSGIMFQFVTHPYDAGDLVMIDGTYMFVDNIGILGTVFVRADGTKLYAPTNVLLTKIIYNVRRSGSMGESFTFNVDFRTDNDLILILREKLVEWVQSQSRDFDSGFDLRVTEILDMNQVILSVWLPHKGNWVDLPKRFQRKTRFMLALKTILTELGIKYELPAQRITSNTDSNPFDTAVPARPQNFSQ